MPLNVDHTLAWGWTWDTFANLCVVFRVFTRATTGQKKLSGVDYWLIAAVLDSLLSDALGTRTTVLTKKAMNLVFEQNLEAEFAAADYAGVLFLLSPADYKEYWKNVYVQSPISYSILWLAKAGFLALYWEVVDQLPSRMRFYVGAVAVYVFLAWVGMLVACFGWCRPIDTNWSMDPNVLCIPLGHKSFITTLFVLVLTSDLLILIIPIILVKRVRLWEKNKWGVLGVGCFASLSMIASIIRYGVLMSSSNNDNGELIDYMTSLENDLAKIALCLPAFRYWIKRMAESPRVRSLTSRTFLRKSNANSTETASGEQVAGGHKNGGEEKSNRLDKQNPHSEPELEAYNF